MGEYDKEIEKCGLVRKFTRAEMGIYRHGRWSESDMDCDNIDMEQLRMGVAVEMEHTQDENIATKIALDHLVECDNYYTRLEVMEKECKKEEYD